MSPYLPLPYLLFCGLVFIFAFSMPVNAQVYKCQGQNQQVIYSDSPCGNDGIITDILVNPYDYQTEDNRSRIMRQLDEAVISALQANDLVRAKALSTTDQHRIWVVEAEKELANQPQKSEATIKAEMASSAACLKAKSNLEAEANSSFNNPQVLEARKSLMYAACGVVEPVVIQQHQAPPDYAYGYPYRFREDDNHRYRDRDRRQNPPYREPRRQSKFPSKLNDSGYSGPALKRPRH